MKHHTALATCLLSIALPLTGMAAVQHQGTCLEVASGQSKVPDLSGVETDTPLCLSPDRRTVAGAVSVPLEVDLDTVAKRLCDTHEWSDLVWFVADAQTTEPTSQMTDVTLSAGGRTTDVRVAVACELDALQVRVYRSSDTPVAELRWVPVHAGDALRLEGHLHVASPVPLPMSIRRLVAQRLLVGPTRALAGPASTAALSLPDSPNLENP